MENAVRVQPTLEDLYLFYFKGVVKNEKTDSFELRKVFSKRLSLIALVGILLFSVLISFSTYQNKYAFDGVSAEGSGKTAVEIDKELPRNTREY